MAGKLPVILAIKAVDQASKTIRDITSQMERMNTVATKKTKKGAEVDHQKIAAAKLKTFSGIATTVGASMTAALTLPIAAAGTSFIRSAADFELGMAELGFRTSATVEQFNELSDAAKRLGVDSGFGFRGTIEGMTALAKAGLKTKEIIAAVPTALYMARAEGIGTTEASELLTNTAKVFNYDLTDVKQIEDVGNIIARASDISSIGMTDIGNSFKYVGLAAAGLNVPLTEVGALVATLGESQIRGETAGTAIRSMLTTITGDAKDIAKLKALGITGNDLFIDGDVTRLKPLKDVLTALGPVLKDNIATTSIFGKEFGTVIQGMYRKLDLYNDNLLQMAEREGKLKALNDKKLATFWGQWDQLKAAFDNIGASMAKDGTLEFFTDFVTLIKDMIVGFNEANPAFKRFAFIMAGILAVAGPLAVAIGGVGFAYGGLTAMAAGGALLPIIAGFAGWGLAIGAVITAIGLLIYKWDDLKLGAVKIWQDIKSAAAEFFDFADISIAKLFRKLEILWGMTPMGFAMNTGSNLIAGVKTLFGAGSSAPTQTFQPPSAQQGLISSFRNPEDWLAQRESQAKVLVDFKNAPMGTTIEQAQNFGSRSTNLEVGVNGLTAPSRGKIKVSVPGRK